MLCRVGWFSAILLIPGLWFNVSGCASPKLRAQVDSRVELLSIVFRLAGNVEFNQPTARSPYADAVDRHFGRWQEHDAVRMARELREGHGIGFDAVPGLAVHLNDSFGLRDDIDWKSRPARLDRRWPMAQVPPFVEALQNFARESDFRAFLESQSRRLRTASSRLTDYIAPHNIVPWFEQYFGASRKARFELLCAMLTGGCSYGTSVRFPDGSEEITPVIGVWRWDEAGAPVFGDDVMPIIIHEFAHVYVNPCVDAWLDALRAAGERLLEADRSRMESMAYAGADALLYESLVRACVVRYRQHVEGEAAGRAQLMAEWGCGFLWTDLLADCLAEYERRRSEFQTFHDFMPTIRDCFERISRDQVYMAARFPRVLSFEPAGTEEGIDGNTSELRITLDRPMGEAICVDAIAPAGVAWMGQPAWTEGGTVLRIPVTLAPDTEYELILNGGGRLECRSREGFPLLPTPISFKTHPH